jgi:hypothetical protein
MDSYYFIISVAITFVYFLFTNLRIDKLEERMSQNKYPNIHGKSDQTVWSPYDDNGVN